MVFMLKLNHGGLGWNGGGPGGDESGQVESVGTRDGDAGGPVGPCGDPGG